MQDPPTGRFDPPTLRDAMARRLYRRSVAAGQITVPAVPALIDEYMKICHHIFASVGAQQTADETAQLRTMLETELARAYNASQRSNIVISYHAPFGVGMNYRVQAEWVTVAGDYDTWVGSREGHCSAPKLTRACRRWPRRRPIRRPIACWMSAPEPDAMPWRWPGADIRWTRWK